MLRRRRGFTLVELMASLSIIGLLVAVLLPAVNYARETARKMSCSNNMRQLGLALQSYHGTFRQLPPGWIGQDLRTRRPFIEGVNGFGWNAFALSYLERDPTLSLIDWRLSLMDSHHDQVRVRPLFNLRCPSDTGDPTFMLATQDGGEVELATANYVGVFGTEEIEDCEGLPPGKVCRGNGAFFHNSRVRFADFLDGQSTTMMVGERSTRVGYSTWLGVVPGGDEAIARILGIADHPPNLDGGHLDDFSSFHSGGTNFLFGDGSVRLITKEIDLSVYRGMATLKGQEVTNDHR